jgi:hypothetical protein
MKMTSSRILTVGAVSLVALLAGCASAPTGPSVLVLPGTGRSFDQFRADDYACRQFAWQQIGGAQADQAINNTAVANAAAATAIGAIAGGAINGSQGAAVGAGTGLLFGSAIGSGSSQAYAYDAQRRYDHAYVQCMYAYGHRVPVSGTMGGATRYQGTTAPPPPAYTPPPPPAGVPPPPPPGVSPR